MPFPGPETEYRLQKKNNNCNEKNRKYIQRNPNSQGRRIANTGE